MEKKLSTSRIMVLPVNPTSITYNCLGIYPLTIHGVYYDTYYPSNIIYPIVPSTTIPATIPQRNGNNPYFQLAYQSAKHI